MTRRLLLRIRKSLKRLDLKSRRLEAEPADRVWHSMLARLNDEERELRLREAETALNRARSRQA